MAQLDDKYGTSYLMIIVMFDISVTIYEILGNQISLILKMNVKVEGMKIETCGIRMEMFDYM